HAGTDGVPGGFPRDGRRPDLIEDPDELLGEDAAPRAGLRWVFECRLPLRTRREADGIGIAARFQGGKRRRVLLSQPLAVRAVAGEVRLRDGAGTCTFFRGVLAHLLGVAAVENDGDVLGLVGELLLVKGELPRGNAPPIVLRALVIIEWQ